MKKQYFEKIEDLRNYLLSNGWESRENKFEGILQKSTTSNYKSPGYFQIDKGVIYLTYKCVLWYDEYVTIVVKPSDFYIDEENSLYFQPDPIRLN